MESSLYEIVTKVFEADIKKDGKASKDIFKDNNQEKLYKKCEHILRKKCNAHKKLSNSEIKVFTKALDFLQKNIHDSTMSKVIPECDIKGYLNFKYDLRRSMSRKADIDMLIDRNYYGNAFDTLYHCLRLDYKKSAFRKRCNYMGIIEVKLSKFSLRNPIYSKYSDLIENNNKIVKDTPYPFLGTGFTAHRYGIPEFYISIGTMEKNEGSFPLEAFDIYLFIINKKNNMKLLLASYNSENYEGEKLYNKFERCQKKEDNDKRTEIIKELQLEEFL